MFSKISKDNHKIARMHWIDTGVGVHVEVVIHENSCTKVRFRRPEFQKATNEAQRTEHKQRRTNKQRTKHEKQNI